MFAIDILIWMMWLTGFAVLNYDSMLIWSRQRIANKTLNVLVGGTLLTQVSFVHYLGVTIDPTLSWNLHVSNVVSIVRSRIASLFVLDLYHQ